MREIARLLGASADTRSLKIDRLYFDVTGEMVELAVSYHHPDRYSYRVQLRRAIR